METLSALLALCAGNSPVSGEFPAQRPVTRSFDVSLICVWMNIWVNNREAGDLRRHHSHYDVTLMEHPMHRAYTGNLFSNRVYTKFQPYVIWGLASQKQFSRAKTTEYLCQSWWLHKTEALYALLALCEGNPSVTGVFPSQRAIDTELWCFLWCQTVSTAVQSRGRWIMMTSSNGNVFHVAGPLCGEFNDHRWITPTKACGAELWFFFHLRLNQHLSKQWRRRWFETPFSIQFNSNSIKKTFHWNTQINNTNSTLTIVSGAVGIERVYEEYYKINAIFSYKYIHMLMRFL